MLYYYCTIYRLQFAMLCHWNTPCTSISVSVHNWPWSYLSYWAASTLAFNYIYWRASETGGIYAPPPLTSMIIRTMESVIIRAPRVQSYWRTFNVDHLITFGILSHHLTKLAFIEQESHIDARYVERSNVFASHNVRFRSCMFYTNMFICDYFRNSWLSKSTFVGRTNILLLLFVRQ